MKERQLRKLHAMLTEAKRQQEARSPGVKKIAAAQKAAARVEKALKEKP